MRPTRSAAPLHGLCIPYIEGYHALAGFLMKILFLLYTAVLTFLLVTNRPQDFVRIYGWRAFIEAWAHLIAFGILAFLATLARTRTPVWLMAAALVFYAGATEVLKGFTASRTPDWKDLLQNLIGIALGIAVAWPISRFWRNLNSKDHDDALR